MNIIEVIKQEINIYEQIKKKYYEKIEMNKDEFVSNINELNRIEGAIQFGKKILEYENTN